MPYSDFDTSPASSERRQLRANLEYLGLIAPEAGPAELAHLLQARREWGYTAEELLELDLAACQRGKERDLQALVMDCDGVLTDGQMIFSKKGDELKHFHAHDGMGLKRWHQQDKRSGIISAGRSTGLVERRAAMMKVEQVYVGKIPKWEILESWLAQWELQPRQVAYIGDDLSDLEIMEKVGFSACPADAVPAVRAAVDLRLQLPGGKGCVRELIDHYLLLENHGG